jgi:hypothetical protein
MTFNGGELTTSQATPPQSDRRGVNAPFPCSTFVYSSLLVGGWSFAVVAGLSVPVALFGAVTATEPVYVGERDGLPTWKWSLSTSVTDSVTHTTHTYSAELDASVGVRTTTWSMYVSGTFPVSFVSQITLNHFLWFSGQSNNSLTEGNWQFYDATTPIASPPNTLIRILWTRASSGSSSTVSFYNNTSFTSSPLYAGVGDSLRFALVGSDFTFAAYDASLAALYTVASDTTTGAGSLTSANGTSCWDTRANGYVCTSCPSATGARGERQDGGAIDYDAEWAATRRDVEGNLRDTRTK